MKLKTILLAAMLGVMFAGCAPHAPDAQLDTKPDTELDALVSKAILAQNEGNYRDGECVAQGHIILGSEKRTDASLDKTVVYALVMYGEYGFENGNFVKVSGSGVIPIRLTFDKDDALEEYLRPMDGSEYEASLKDMFPHELLERALSISDSDTEACKNSEREYAERYLNTIGREAKIGEYADFEHSFPEMDTEISNTLLEMFPDYPIWVGTTERLESGVRYVYERLWDENNKTVTFKKYEYDTGSVIEESSFNVSDGKLSAINQESKA